MKLGGWLLLAFFFRLIAAWTHANYSHPDEWYKTVEIAEHLIRGQATYCQEIAMHMMNLTWAFMLTVPLWIAQTLFPHSMHARVFSFQLFTGILDLGIVWAWWVFLQALCDRFQLGNRWRTGGMLLLLLPWSLAHDSVRPNIEHLSTIAFWVSLGMIAKKRYLWAGFFAVAIFAFRYPSSLFSAGILFGLIWQALVSREWKPLIRFSIACVFGIFVFGLPDWIIYGRPWESFWMYTQYNVFTGLSRTVFGKQSVNMYWQYFAWRYFRSIFPFGLVALIFSVYGFWRALKRAEIWTFASLFYLVGHLLIGHKEQRFIAPMEIVVLWAAFEGAVYAFQSASVRTTFSRVSKILVPIAIIIFFVNFALFLKNLWGDTFRGDSTYFEVAEHLRDTPNTCAIITTKRQTSIGYPDFGASIPQPAFGIIHTERHIPSFSQAQTNAVAFVEHAPDCKQGDSVLINLWRPDEQWNQHGCELLASGVLKYLPRKSWQFALDHDWVSGPWYACPVEILKVFPSTPVEKTLYSTIKKIENLPGIGAKGSELLKLDREQTPEPNCVYLCPG